MAFVQNQGATIYWDEQGQGEPILLIMGLGYSSVMWYRKRPALAARYRTLAFDNRGVGRGELPSGPYSMALMASDAAAVLDAAETESAHIFGVSMGGMIGQEFALEYPHRVRSLIVGSSAAGGPTAVRAEPAATQLLMTRDKMNPEQAAQAAVSFIYDAGTPRNLIDEDLAVRRPWFSRPEAYVAQLQGILAWESYTRLPKIRVLTLVIQGESDRLGTAGECQNHRGSHPKRRTDNDSARQPPLFYGSDRSRAPCHSAVSSSEYGSTKTYGNQRERSCPGT